MSKAMPNPAAAPGFCAKYEPCGNCHRCADPTPTLGAENDAPCPVLGVAGEVAQFNDLVPVGARVLFWPGARAGRGIPSKTRTRAWLLGDHTPVVMVEGYGGGIALTHVCPIPPGKSDTEQER